VYNRDLLEHLLAASKDKNLGDVVFRIALEPSIREPEWTDSSLGDEARQHQTGLPQQVTRLSAQVDKLENRMLQTDSDMQDVKNLCNKYLQVDAREEAIGSFRGFISLVAGVREVYALHRGLTTTFWIFYDKRKRVDILEDVIDVECKFERLFRNLDFNYEILPYEQRNSSITSQGTLVFKSSG
jgi:hypothetical protein